MILGDTVITSVIIKVAATLIATADPAERPSLFVESPSTS